MLEVNADFARSAWLAPEAFRWMASPQAGVERVPLDRVGDEVAVATSLVRYLPASRFSAHEHGLGEEYLVLEGEFGDEHGRYPRGTYVRNPAGTRHSPFSDPGCVIWVKLRQFHPEDQRRVVIDADVNMPYKGSARRQLYRFRDELVTILAAPPETKLLLPAATTVQELFVVTGEVVWEDRVFGRWGWIREPAGQGIRLTASAPLQLLYKTRPGYALPTLSSATSSASAGT